MTIARRIRGLLGCAMIGATTWAPISVATVLALRLGVPDIPLYFTSSMSHALYVAAVFGAAFGAICGTMFGLLLFASERSRSVEDFRTRRFVACGAIASAAGFIGIYGNALDVVGGSVFCAATLGVAAWGAASSASVLRVARRGQQPRLSAGEDQPQLPRGAT
ncbi:MAG: hypothetical protein ACO1Q7_07115 [Gemmatimonas sp.]